MSGRGLLSGKSLLKQVVLEGTSVTGFVDPSLWTADLPAVQVFDIAGTGVSGVVDFGGGGRNITHFLASGAGLQGIEGLGGLQKLKVLRLDGNNISGPFPWSEVRK